MYYPRILVFAHKASQASHDIVCRLVAHLSRARATSESES